MARIYLPPPKRYRRRSWNWWLPRYDRQEVPGWFQRPKPVISGRGLRVALPLSILLWVGIVALALAVLA